MKKALINLLIAVSAALLLVSVGWIIYRNWEYKRSADDFTSLSSEVRAMIDGGQAGDTAVLPESTDAPSGSTAASPGDTTAPPDSAHSAPGDAAASPAPEKTGSAEAPPASPGSTALPTQAPDPRLVAYRQVAAEHPDFVGWLRVEGTVIDYPVMQSMEEAEKYLHRNFNGEDSYPGTPFILPNVDLEKPSDVITIYAHHMKDGSMFAGLSKYEEEAGFTEQPYVEFDSLYALGQYQIFAAFRTSIGEEGEFKYYNYADFADEAAFNAYVGAAKEQSLYETGITPAYGTQLLALSTCDYHEAEGRLVVVCVRIPEEK